MQLMASTKRPECDRGYGRRGTTGWLAWNVGPLDHGWLPARLALLDSGRLGGRQA